MILLTDISLFVGEINIPNTDTPEVASSLNLFIRKHEPVILQDVLGYSLYKALQAALQANSSAVMWTDLIFGAEYINAAGYTTKWRGLIDTDSNIYSFNNGTVAYKAPQTIEAGVTTDVDGNVLIPPNATSFTITDWIGWEPIIYRKGVDFLTKGEDYDYNKTTGTVTLLKVNDRLDAGEKLMVQFQMLYNNQLSSSEYTYKRSFIANYVYWFYMRNTATFTTGIGEKKPVSGNALNASPADKMWSAWNEMIDWLRELWEYLNSNRDVYVNWKGVQYCVWNKYRKGNSLGI